MRAASQPQPKRQGSRTTCLVGPRPTGSACRPALVHVGSWPTPLRGSLLVVWLSWLPGAPGGRLTPLLLLQGPPPTRMEQ